MLGESFDGVLSSDHFSVYNGYDVSAQQKCLAHLRRHFKRLSLKAVGGNQKMAKAFLKQIDEAFRQHRQWRKTQNTKAYHEWASQFKKRLAAALKRWHGKVAWHRTDAAQLTSAKGQTVVVFPRLSQHPS